MGHMLSDEVEELRQRLESTERMRELLATGRDAARDFATTLSEHNLVALEIQAWCARVDAALETEAVTDRPDTLERPDGWPEKCGRCGADWTHIGFDYADGFNCRACGGCDADE